MKLALPSACPVDDGIRVEVLARDSDGGVVGREELTIAAPSDDTDEWKGVVPNAIEAAGAALLVVLFAVWRGVRRGRKDLVVVGTASVDKARTAATASRAAGRSAQAAARAAKQVPLPLPGSSESARAEVVALITVHVDAAHAAAAASATAFNEAIAGATEARRRWSVLDVDPAYRDRVLVLDAEAALDKAAVGAIEANSAALDAAHQLATAAQRKGTVAATKVVEARSGLSLLLATSQAALVAPLRRRLDVADASIHSVLDRAQGEEPARPGVDVGAALEAAVAAKEGAETLKRRVGQIHSARERLVRSFDVLEPVGGADAKAAERAAVAVAAQLAADAQQRIGTVADRLTEAVAHLVLARAATTGHALDSALRAARREVDAAVRESDAYGWPVEVPETPLSAEVVAHPIRRRLSQLKPGWSIQDSWATNITVGVTLLTTFLTTSSVLDSILGEAPKDWLGALAVMGAVGTALGAVAVLVVRAAAASDDEIHLVPVAVGAVLTLFGTALLALTVLRSLLDLFPDDDVAVWIGWLLLVAVVVVVAVRSLARIVADVAPPAEPEKPSDALAAGAQVADAIGALTRAVTAAQATASSDDRASDLLTFTLENQVADSEAAARVAPPITERAAMAAQDPEFLATFDVSYAPPPPPPREPIAAVL